MKIHTVSTLPQGWLAYPYTNSGYRVYYSWNMAVNSIFNFRHNEIWMIWSEIVPTMGFIWMFLSLVHTGVYAKMNATKQYFCIIMYFAGIFCRACSFVYHTFNCVSLKANQSLINIDYIGIATNSLAVPWISYLYFEYDAVDNIYIKHLMASYYLVFTWLYVETVMMYARGLIGGKSMPIDNLIWLYVLGNIPTNIVVLFSSQPDAVKMHLLQGQFCLVSGFLLFFHLKIPESIFGYSSLLNSHVFWHVFTALGQSQFLLTTFE
jgi:predicted membrane channel-forming protein YqfA (hemolysin III family)